MTDRPHDPSLSYHLGERAALGTASAGSARGHGRDVPMLCRGAARTGGRPCCSTVKERNSPASRPWASNTYSTYSTLINISAKVLCKRKKNISARCCADSPTRASGLRAAVRSGQSSPPLQSGARLGMDHQIRTCLDLFF